MLLENKNDLADKDGREGDILSRLDQLKDSVRQREHDVQKLGRLDTVFLVEDLVFSFLGFSVFIFRI